eukprot:CAMPEP_0198282938 /NCGR_PEP_ID=MMETSP1449-20131203/2638_1 /TAXON_ID=420275 /ORGANISM="Attheya septentrionalis, Strain CCMP2084" /LENGTH=726 /DNA_ID=CAMNT_0043979357 /DNA_START=105 /DNA_END=2285 /DNA_ORIENTATION=+
MWSNHTNQQWTPAGVLLLCLLSILVSHTKNVHAFSMVRPTTTTTTTTRTTRPVTAAVTSMTTSTTFPWGKRTRVIPTVAWAKPPNEEEENDDDDDDDDEDMLGTDFDETKGVGDLPSLKNLGRPREQVNVKLGINLELNPMSPEDAADLKAEATELINDAFAERLDEIAKLRQRFSREADRSAKAAGLNSELRAEKASRELQTKVDRLAGDFLSATQSTRASTKLAAQADRNNIKNSRGLEIGSWGRLTDDDDDDDDNDATVPTGFSTEPQPKAPIQYNDFGDPMPESFVASLQEQKNRIFVLCDEGKDPMAKAVLGEFQSLLNKAFPSDQVEVEVVNPNLGSTAVPFGANNAQCAIVFGTSIPQGGVNSLKPLMERVLRRTALPGVGQYGTPPTHLVGISTVGTERTNIMPYNMQNLLGGKLTQRRQMEEFLISTVQNRVPSPSSPPLDYTILKFGNLIPDNTNTKSNNMDLSMLPGDVLDGDIGIKTAANILLQAVAFQPYARNATLCATGRMTEDNDATNKDPAMWDDLFLRLDGPELFRTTVNVNVNVNADDSSLTKNNEFDRLSEYMMEWAELTFRQRKSLTTPVDVVPSQRGPDPEFEGVVERSGVRILFRSTNTGNAYQSFDEERTMESSTTPPTTRSTTSTGKESTTGVSSRRKTPKREGGVEVLMEQTTDGTLRVRARRCAMKDDTVIKEISEATILKRLEEALDVWNKSNQNTPQS